MKVPRNASPQNVQEEIVLKNKQELNSLMHKMQVFQREVMHFTNNLEYYIKNSALKKCCQDLSEKLQKMRFDNDGESIDMDALIKVHKNF